jgi:sporulation protein YlmC with PRC-barrel domain
MRIRSCVIPRSFTAALAAAVCVLAAAIAHAQDDQALYRGWSAQEMLGAQVRGPAGQGIGKVEDLIVGDDGSMQRVVVRMGGTIFGIGATYVGVPWEDVAIGPELAYVQVPVTEENRADYPLYGQRDAAPGVWRVKELIHDIARLQDEPFYGRVHDVIFGDSGKASWVVVDRRTGLWGPAGPYAHPFTGYRPGSAYDLPERSTDLPSVSRFDYVRFGELSRFSSADTGAGAGSTR